MTDILRRWKRRPREAPGGILGHPVSALNLGHGIRGLDRGGAWPRGRGRGHRERGRHVSGGGAARNTHAGGCVSGRRPMLSAPRPGGGGGGGGIRKSTHHVESAQEPVRGRGAHPAGPPLARPPLLPRGRRADAARHPQPPGRAARAPTSQPHRLWA